ncbi:MAG: sugar ABC transporter permease [Oscillospiraceae bacterium]
MKRPTSHATTLNRRNTLIGLAFIMPNFLGFFIFVLIPVVCSFVLAFSRWDGYNAMEFAGFDNFIKIFNTKVFVKSLGITFVYTFFTVIFTMVVSLGLAVLLNQKLRGRNFFRSAIFFPFVASTVAVGVVWNNMFQPQFGPINSFLRFIGIDQPPAWFASTDWALPAVIIVSIWKGMGYYMIIYLAGLQGISPSLYEAAEIDGASKWQSFLRITLPMLASSTFFVCMMLTINSFKVFDMIFVLTEGGPGTSTTVLAKYIYDQSFVAVDYGRASAASLVLFLIVGSITILQFYIEKKSVDY